MGDPRKLRKKYENQFKLRDRINKNYRLILEFIISSIIGYFREI